jgi:lipoprotein NlpI
LKALALAGVFLTVTLVAGARADDPGELVAGGMRKFRHNDIAGSLADFDRAARLNPNLAPHLWQRGIADYYAGKFEAGRRQFESHQTVNPHDVENAAWHFLCVARLEGLEAARKSLIKIDTTRDTRVPMAEIYDLFAGRCSPADVRQAAANDQSPTAMMYADLYLGLYSEAAGHRSDARKSLRAAADANVPDNYMHDVAKVHVQQRHWDN